MPASSMNIQRWRQQIPATTRCIYMNTGWSGPSPQPVIDAITHRLALESAEGPTAPHVLESRRQLAQQTRQRVAALLHASPEEIVLTQNTTEGLNIVTNGLALSPGDQVVTCNLEHSSVIVPAYYLRERRGVELRIVPLESSDTAEQVLAKFAQAIGSRTRLLFLSHISYSNGMRLPLAELCRMAHHHGALVLADGAQTAGQIPLDMEELGCDFYAIPGHKWLLGPDGVGALYIRHDLIQRLEPAKVAHSAAESYDFAGHFAPRRDDVRKFELTTTSGPLWAGFSAAIDFIQGIGQEAIWQRIQHLAARLVAKLTAIPKVTIISPQGELACGLVCFAIDGLDPAVVTALLWQRGRIVGRTVHDTACTRLSLHFFNSEEELETVAAVVEALARERPKDVIGTTSRIEETAIREL